MNDQIIDTTTVTNISTTEPPTETPQKLGERGQATAEYALVIVAAAAIALALIVWATSSGALSSLFDTVMARVSSHV